MVKKELTEKQLEAELKKPYLKSTDAWGLRYLIKNSKDKKVVAAAKKELKRRGLKPTLKKRKK